MPDIKYVSTREELKTALQAQTDYIVVTDARLARNITIVKTASGAALAAAIASAGIGVTMCWNPLGWAGTALVVTVSGALVVAVVFLVVVLGIGLLWALHKNYKVVAKGRVKLPNGIEVEGEIILQPT